MSGLNKDALAYTVALRRGTLVAIRQILAQQPYDSIWPDMQSLDRAIAEQDAFVERQIAEQDAPATEPLPSED